MNPEFASLLKLGRAERLQLVEDLWDSIAQENAAPPLPVPDWKTQELRQRKQQLNQNPDSARTWEETQKLARAK